MPTRRSILKTGTACAGIAALRPLRGFAFQRPSAQVKIFDVLKYGASGDGKTLQGAGAGAGRAQVYGRDD
jgi:hypothetical protein